MALNKDNIETIIALQPMQTQFLWQHLSGDAISNLVQVRLTLEGSIDLTKLEASWRQVVMQYQTLRSTVHWQKLKAPIQVVHKVVDIPFVVIEQDQNLTADDYAKRDKQQALALNEEVPYRMAVFAASPGKLDVVWTVSHVLLDGWSCVLVINEWIEAYSSQLKGSAYSVEKSPCLTDLARWHKLQDKDAEIRFWDGYLPPLMNKTWLSGQKPSRSGNTGSGLAKQRSFLEKSEVSKLTVALQVAGLNWVTAVQAAFCIVLQQQGKSIPSVFATTVAGRHMDIPEINQHIGMLSNMIPLCLSPLSEVSTKNWLRDQQTRFFSCLPYAHTSPQSLASLRSDADPLFQALLVVENQPTVVSTSDVTINHYRSDIVSSFPCTVVIVPGERLQIECRYDSSRLEKSTITDLLSRFEKLLLHLSERLEQNCRWLEAYSTGASITRASSSSTSDSSASESSTARLQPWIAPRAITENGASASLPQTVAAIWHQVLHSSHIDPEVSFFDLGGTSLQAVMLFDQLEKALGLTLPATTLFNAPTITQLVAHIETLSQVTSLGNQSSSVISIHPDGKEPPLIVPFEQADMLMYQPLFDLLGTEQPIIGLQIPQSAFPSEESLSQLALKITQLYPAEPFRLAGLSGAGMVAWELAQRLTAQGRQVDLLVLLDSYGPMYPQLLPHCRRLLAHSHSMLAALATLCIRGFKKLSNMIVRRLFILRRRSEQPAYRIPASSELSQTTFNQRFKERIDKEIRFSSRFILETLQHKPLFYAVLERLCLAISQIRFRSVNVRMEFTMFTQGTLLKTCRELLESPHTDTVARADTENPSEPNSELAQQLLAMDPNRFGSAKPYCRDMLLRYQRMYRKLQPYHGKVLYGRARQRPAGVVDDPVAGWGHLLKGQVTLVDVPGNHTTMLKSPNVIVLGDALKKQLSGSSD